MPRKACCWTRKMELQLVDFVRHKECIWKPFGNTNYHIKQKYKAYAEFAAKIGKGFTARSVRDRWVNIRSTFNHNLRRVERSKAMAKSSEDLYVPCWPLWKPLQFLSETSKVETDQKVTTTMELAPTMGEKSLNIKNEIEPNDPIFEIRQRPRRSELTVKHSDNKRCLEVTDKLLAAIKPVVDGSIQTHKNETYWYFGRHVTERLNNMTSVDAQCACSKILQLLERTYKQEVT